MAKKLFYKIGEACKKVDVQPYVLRYWETEFELLSPDKSKSGQRVYTEEDLAIIRRIKELLYDEGYTTVGAKKKLQAELAEGDGQLDSKPPEVKRGSSKKSTSKKASSKQEAPKKESSEKASSAKAAPEKEAPEKVEAKPAEAKSGEPSGTRGTSAKAKSGEAEDAEGANTEPNVDPASEKRVAELEAGLRQALEQAQEILQRID